MVKKLRRWIKRLSLKSAIVLCAVVMVLTTCTVYVFSFDSKAHVLVCTGNYYLSDSQIYDLAKASRDSHYRLIPGFVYENRVKQMPLVDSVDVQKANGRLKFDVKEKDVIGYYVKGDKNYMLTIDNESIPLDQKYLKLIIHFPLLNGFTAKQRKDICVQFKKHKKVLNRSIIEKIAEMVPYKTSYDKNMIKMTMQDGNVVYTSLSSLVMMAKYQAMLTQLQGENVCLLLDANNSAIEKIDCGDLKVTKKKKKTTKKKADEEKPATESQDNQNQSEDGWTMDEETGLEYNAMTGLYRDPTTKEEYIWNEQTQTFDAVNSQDQSYDQDPSQDWTNQNGYDTGYDDYGYTDYYDPSQYDPSIYGYGYE